MGTRGRSPGFRSLADTHRVPDGLIYRRSLIESVSHSGIGIGLLFQKLQTKRQRSCGSNGHSRRNPRGRFIRVDSRLCGSSQLVRIVLCKHTRIRVQHRVVFLYCTDSCIINLGHLRIVCKQKYYPAGYIIRNGDFHCWHSVSGRQGTCWDHYYCLHEFYHVLEKIKTQRTLDEHRITHGYRSAYRLFFVFGDCYSFSGKANHGSKLAR